MSVFEEVWQENQERKQRLREHKLNCIPFPFKRFKTFFPGFEQGKYILLTANQKVKA